MALILNWKERGSTLPADVQRPVTQLRLLEQVRDVIRRKYYSIRTEQAYIQWIRRFILFHGKRNPREMGAVEVEQFLTHLAVDGKAVSSTQNQALNAIVFPLPLGAGAEAWQA
ncbi:MAG: site-specific integrase [Gammaproteobacteria bacterium]